MYCLVWTVFSYGMHSSIYVSHPVTDTEVINCILHLLHLQVTNKISKYILFSNFWLCKMLVYIHDPKHVIMIAQRTMHLSVKKALKISFAWCYTYLNQNWKVEYVQIWAGRYFPSGPRYSLQNPGWTSPLPPPKTTTLGQIHPDRWWRRYLRELPEEERESRLRVN